MISLILTRRTFLQLMGASTGAAITGSELLSKAAAGAAPAHFPHGSGGVEHVVVLMMENRSFDHFLSWLPGADGRHDMSYLSADGNVYRNYPLAPDFQGCGYSDPDHSWEGFLVQHNDGKMDGFLQRPTAPVWSTSAGLVSSMTRGPVSAAKLMAELPLPGCGRSVAASAGSDRGGAHGRCRTCSGADAGEPVV
jgi:phospholipase C